MKTLKRSQIKKSMSNVRATLSMEGLSLRKRAAVNGLKYLKGQTTSKEVIQNITDYILEKSGNRK